jgi:PAS domain S-box-containing protein
MIYQLNKAGQFVHVNKTGLDKLGYSLEEMLQMRLWDLVPKGREAEVLAYLERLVSQGRSTIETVFVAGDGHPIDVEIHATALFESGGGLVHSRAFVRDVTERRLFGGTNPSVHDQAGTGGQRAHTTTGGLARTV